MQQEQSQLHLLHLLNHAQGNLEAILEADWMGQMRTGAATGVAAKYLSRAESSVVGLFGSLVKGVHDAGWPVDPSLATAVFVPVSLLTIWWIVRRVRPVGVRRWLVSWRAWRRPWPAAEGLGGGVGRDGLGGSAEGDQQHPPA
jgi:hypothetical protein